MKKKAKSGQCFVLQSILMVYRNDNWGASLSFQVALPEKNQTHTQTDLHKYFGEMEMVPR